MSSMYRWCNNNKNPRKCKRKKRFFSREMKEKKICFKRSFFRHAFDYILCLSLQKEEKLFYGGVQFIMWQLKPEGSFFRNFCLKQTFFVCKEHFFMIRKRR
jgi:hypothetical protein